MTDQNSMPLPFVDPDLLDDSDPEPSPTSAAIAPPPKQIGGKKTRKWFRRLPVIFEGMANASNIGVLLQAIASWGGHFLKFAVPTVTAIASYSNPLIYVFRPAGRLARMAGRRIFGEKFFATEKYGTHKHQTKADLFSMIFFTLAALILFGCILSSPWGIAIGWACGLSALSVVGYFDYGHRVDRTYDHYKMLEAKLEPKLEEVAPAPVKRNVVMRGIHKAHDFIFGPPIPDPKHPEVKAAKKTWEQKRRAKRLLYALLIGMAFLTICSSVAVFAPPALAPVLYILYKAASIYMGTIYTGILFAWLHRENKLAGLEKLWNKIKNCFSKKPPQETVTNPTEVLNLLPEHAAANEAQAAEAPPPIANIDVPQPVPSVAVEKSRTMSYSGCKKTLFGSDEKPSMLKACLEKITPSCCK